MTPPRGYGFSRDQVLIRAWLHAAIELARSFPHRAIPFHARDAAHGFLFSVWPQGAILRPDPDSRRLGGEILHDLGLTDLSPQLDLFEVDGATPRARFCL